MARDTSGQNRTLYSRRNSYATQELFAGNDIHTLAKRMGTSMMMLEEHYGHVQLRKKAHAIAGGKSYKD